MLDKRARIKELEREIAARKASLAFAADWPAKCRTSYPNIVTKAELRSAFQTPLPDPDSDSDFPCAAWYVNL